MSPRLLHSAVLTVDRDGIYGGVGVHFYPVTGSGVRQPLNTIEPRQDNGAIRYGSISRVRDARHWIDCVEGDLIVSPEWFFRSTDKHQQVFRIGCGWWPYHPERDFHDPLIRRIASQPSPLTVRSESFDQFRPVLVHIRCGFWTPVVQQTLKYEVVIVVEGSTRRDIPVSVGYHCRVNPETRILLRNQTTHGGPC